MNAVAIGRVPALMGAIQIRAQVLMLVSLTVSTGMARLGDTVRV